VIPFLETRERLRSYAASLLVVFAARLLRWQDPVCACERFCSRVYAVAMRYWSNSAVAPSLSLTNQHAIAVAIEAIPSVDGVFVRRQNVFASRKRGD
jgi:hypothetical protein